MHRLLRNMLQQSPVSFRYTKIRVLNFGTVIQVLWTLNQNLEYIIRIITGQKIRQSIVIRQPSAVVIFEQPKSRKVTLYSHVYIRPWMFKEENWWRVYILPRLSNGTKIFNIWYFKTYYAKNSISDSFFYSRCRIGACPTKKETAAQVLSCEFCEIFKYTFFFWNTSGRLLLIMQSSNSNYGTIHCTTPFISFKQLLFQVNIKFQATGFFWKILSRA